MPLYTFAYTLKVVGPLITQASSPTAHGVDTFMARDASGHPMIPGTLLEGKLREAWHEMDQVDLADPALAKELLGDEPSSGNEPIRGRLTVHDAVSQEEEDSKTHTRKMRLRHRISIDDRFGSAIPGHLQTIETPFQIGETIEFKGKATLYSASDQIEPVEKLLASGLRWLTHLGAYGSVGYGRLASATIAPPTPNPTGLRSEHNVRAKFFWISIAPHQPMCFAKRRVDKNLFESEAFIPGAAIKGALVSTCFGPNTKEAKGDLFDKLGGIRISHAFPSDSKSVRKYRLPLSVVECNNAQGERELRDVALCPKPILINGEAPSFQVDWKPPYATHEKLGWPDVDTEIRVRTAIDSVRRRHKEEALFAYEMIRPGTKRWIARVDVDDESLGIKLQEFLSGGLAFLGKTKATADVECLPFEQVQTHHPRGLDPIQDTDGTEVWIVSLQSDALLGDPFRKCETGIRDSAWLLEAYQSDFADISKGSLELKHFYAEQSLAGGYLRHRFNDLKGGSYYPYLLTAAGSVFVLKKVKSDAQKVIENWYANGLSLPSWATERYGNTWKTNPLIPANGYGEIAVNLPCHTDLRPTTDECEEINGI